MYNMVYLEIANKIIELMKANTNYSTIKHYDTNYFGDMKQAIYPACSVVMTGKSPVEFFDDGKIYWNLDYTVSINMKGAKAQVEKAYTYDEAFEQMVKTNKTLGGLCVDSKIYGSSIDVTKDGQIMTILQINYGVEVIL